MSTALVLAVGLTWSAGRAPAAEAQEVIDQLLREGWQVGPDGMAAAREGTAAARRLQNADAMYAAGLALLRHHQYDEAAEVFQAAIEVDPKHYPSWRALIWIRTLQDKFDAALVQVQRLSKQLPPNELAAAEEANVLETVRLLGRLFGFYEGPRSGDVSAALVTRARDAIRPALVGQRQTEFDNNYQDVATLFTSSSTDQQDAKDDAKLKEQMEKQNNQQQLEIRRKQIQVDQQQATDQIDKLRSEWTQEEQRFAQLEVPLNISISQLESQQNVIRRELAILIDDVFRLTEERRQTNDPVRKDRLDREIFRLERLINDYERDLALVQAEGRRLVASRDVLRTSRLQTQQRFEAEIKQHADRKQDLERAEKRLTLETRRNNRPATGNSAKVRVLSAKTSSIRTYYDFPLEVERLTLLGR
ncbi:MULTISPECIES: tetratricopeptide repeat protein [Pirellulaceae]|uniref:tetratricopeptide repeat protein n=1 Tax=Pirellulaceae TaxID=2691357 RepID=UPI001304D479|nr:MULTISPECIES: tetratricopeptide repeat protein [Pirellulaceae]